MEATDKTIEVMKAAMEKECNRMDGKESVDDRINTEAEATFDETLAAADENDASQAEVTNEEDDPLVVAEAENDGKAAKQGKSFFKSNKNKELAAKDVKLEELTDRLMRTMAEFDNFRKRTEKEKSQMYDIGVKSTIEKLLPIVDNFERGLGALTEKDRENAFAQGMEMIYKQLINSLEEIGVKQIEAVGQEFDPALHNAVMHGEDDTLGENIITDEFQKGYIYRDSVVRYSMVKVVN